MTTILLTGDAIPMTRGFSSRIDRAIAKQIRDADIAFTNAEFCCASLQEPPLAAADGKVAIRLESWALDELQQLGFNLYALANNQAGSFGPGGVLQTLEQFGARNLVSAGAGRSLAEARAAAYVESGLTRIALISATSSNAIEYLASDGAPRVAPRAGLCPLRFSTVYHLADEDFLALQTIDNKLGARSARSKLEALGILPKSETRQQENFGFGQTRILRSNETKIVTETHRPDLVALCENVMDAAAQADVVLVSLHCHEGAADVWNSDYPADFIVESAHALIDAGATAIVGHGPHRIRGIEFYKGKPIIYSLGTFIFQAQVSEVITPEMYLAQRLVPGVATPRQFWAAIMSDASGKPKGFEADRRYWQGFIAKLDTSDREEPVVEITPYAMNQHAAKALRGLPAVAEGDELKDIIESLSALSQPLGATVEFDERRSKWIAHGSR